MRQFLTINVRALILMLFVFVVGASAQKLKFVEKPLRFTASNSSLTLTGTVTDKIRPVYTFRAKKGQTLTVRLTSKEENVWFDVFYKSDKDTGFLGAEETKEWSTKLGRTDAYEIVIFYMLKGAAKYTLEVSLK